MNKVLISTAKVVILFTVSTFFAYMILKAQIKGSMKQKQAEKTKVEPKTEVTEYILTNAEPNRNRNAVLTYVGSSKVDTTDIDLDVEGLDLVDEEEPKNYFETSKAVLTTVSIENVGANTDEKVFFPTSKSAPLAFDELSDAEKLIQDEDTQIQIFELEAQIRKLKAKIAELKKSRD